MYRDSIAHVEAFATLAYAAGAEKMKERCAKVCGEREDTGDSTGIERDVNLWNSAVKSCVKAIRALGENDDK